jgi:type IV secretion system protein VirB11
MSDPRAAEVEMERRLIAAMQHALGPLVCERLDDPNVIELLLNADGRLWEDRLGAGMRQIGTMAANAAESFISMVASSLRATVTRENPILEAELPIRGARFEAIIPPVVSAPAFAIRLKAVKIFTLGDYVADGILTERQHVFIENAVHSRRNILISGGTGTGKTTLANAVLATVAEKTPEDRLVILEDQIS